MYKSRVVYYPVVPIVFVNKHIATSYHMHELAMGDFQETFIYLYIIVIVIEAAT